MKFTNVLDDILGQKSKVRLLRYFLNSELELTGRQVSKLVSLHHRTVHSALKELASLGIVVMHQAGKAIVYKINSNSLLVKKILKPIFELEKNLLTQAIAAILKHDRIRIISAIIFGSVAQAKERGTSDVDVLFLVPAKKEQDRLNAYLENIEYSFILEYGNKLSPLVFTIDEFIKRLKNKDKLTENIIQNGRSVYGKTIQEVLIECQRRK